ncbi:MAG TPA: hypothetical protein VKA15_25760, partial [Isosphaeraceae bacterium]|nr:hypothetical protein [Isosphaeraceae bacterium]
GEDVARNGSKLATDERGVGQAFQPDVRLESLTYGKQCKVSLTMIVRDEYRYAYCSPCQNRDWSSDPAPMP